MAASLAKCRVALCQLLSGSDKAANVAGALQAIAAAASQKADIIALPECFNSPYATSSFPVYAEAIPASRALIVPSTHPTTAALSDAAREHGIFLVGGSIPERDSDGRIYNSCVVFGPDGEIIAKHRKVREGGGGGWRGKVFV
jgi:omega-amidase